MKSRTKLGSPSQVTVALTLKSHAQDPKVKEKLVKAVEFMNQVKRTDS